MSLTFYGPPAELLPDGYPPELLALELAVQPTADDDASGQAGTEDPASPAIGEDA